MMHRRFVSRLLNRPQLISPSAGAAVMATLMPGVRLAGFDGEAEDVGRSGRDYQIGQGMAIIPVIGELVHRGGWMDAYSGVTSYQALSDMVSDALGDSNVDRLLLDIDSPGGEGAGCLDFAEWLAAQRGTKPIWASVNQQACSAAYAIASAADRILIGQDAYAGSIGAVAYHTDLSKALDKEGVIITYIYAGDRKIDGASALPLSAEAKAIFQSEIDAMYSRFTSVVAKNRGMSDEAVRATQAGIFRGGDAVGLGLADEVATFEETIMSLTTVTAPAGAQLTLRRPVGGPRMGKTTPEADAAATPAPEVPVVVPAPEVPAQPAPGEPGAIPADKPEVVTPNPAGSPGYTPVDPAAVAEACHTAGFPQLTAPLLRSKASMTAVMADIERAKVITATAQQTGRVSMAAAAIEDGVSAETFRKMAFASKADAEPKIDTTAPTAAAAAPSLDTTDVYGRFNGKKKAA